MARPVKMWQAENGSIFPTKEGADEADALDALRRNISSLLGHEMASDDEWNECEVTDFIVKHKVALMNLFENRTGV